ncbi:MAG: FtsX-like permease family protein, partial [bacterium]|nr:FtsX-like permease family protein [bacterium]
NSVFLAIASISLLVGGIGIMNIMLVPVTERTREIGILKAIGATHKDILNQFLLEAILITLAGGIMGISVGGLLSYLGVQAFNKIAGQNLEFFFSLQAVLAGITISIITGIIFGLYPAFKASKKDPIEALRYE